MQTGLPDNTAGKQAMTSDTTEGKLPKASNKLDKRPGKPQTTCKIPSRTTTFGNDDQTHGHKNQALP